MNLIATKVLNPLIHLCEKCDCPILAYGRMVSSSEWYDVDTTPCGVAKLLFRQCHVYNCASRFWIRIACISTPTVKYCVLTHARVGLPATFALLGMKMGVGVKTATLYDYTTHLLRKYD